ncbi:NUDIX hydrolase [Alysiella filiformis]|uniref:GDP-mannose pyrophosphatase n=1 Tax=Alysiella filiformis DSM 16848 TaxID=1120981 RepID=A0A286E2B4_9NEIS|nr:NUDIX hydrolase [Alysiella filiformis]QMT30877.1 NUDIX hydrolase [Alysiella filiformis]UBQ56138.1 NUDIX hydrolase [Alysiella filiformis DSM 16848]SOD65037.1 ADP-ribose pyrophosphatase [Alysiella filiformis DSM 16848]
MDLTETQISSTAIHDASFLKVYQDQIRLPNGNSSQRLVIRHPGAACVLAITPENQVVLVRQWRYATGQALLEIPAGKLDEGEDPAQCALRELAEETPYSAERVEKILHFYSAPGFCDEVLHVYRAINVQANSTLQPDADEFVETVLYSAEQVRQAIANNEICDAKTLIALQTWLMGQS